MKNFTLLLMIIMLSLPVAAQDDQSPVKEPMKPVLIVIDTQNQYLQYMDERDKRLGLEMINWAMATFRGYGFPVVLVYHTDPQFGPSPESEEFQYPEVLKIMPDDPKVIKNYANAFKKTDLKKIVDELGANTLFLCGLSSVGCVISTYHGAKDLDYDVVLLEDAMMSHDADFTESIEQIFDSVNFSVMEIMLKHAPAGK